MAPASVGVERDPRPRALALLRRFGWNPSSSQILDRGYRHWFSRDAVVGYVDTGRALVVAGAPVCDEQRLSEVSERFAALAARHGRRVVCFGVHDRFARNVRWPTLPIGEVPYWEPPRWADTRARAPSLRAQLRRARAKGVSVQRVALEHRAVLTPLRRRWLAARPLPAMGFLVNPATLHAEHQLWVAVLAGAVIGYACAAPVYQRDGLLLQELVRAPAAPNGTAELLVDAVFESAAAQGLGYATLGLAPLAGALPGWLRITRRLGRPLFDFEGLRAFKAKFRPHGWEAARLAAPAGHLEWALLDALSAFAHGSLSGFLGATLKKALEGAHSSFASQGAEVGCGLSQGFSPQEGCP